MVLCSGAEHDVKMVDGIAWAGARSTKLDKMGFFSKLTMILLPLNLVRDYPPPFLGSGRGSSDRDSGAVLQKWQNRGIIPE
jgi:hypothetical protein